MNWPFWSRRRPASSDLNTDDLNTETCDDIEPLLSLYADGMAAPEETLRVEAHLAVCADCREALSWMQATHRALASRPLMAPPANLQARIAEAIAASSTVPLRLSPVRKFQMRPAYAAAASLTVLGVVLSLSLLHSPPPSPVVAHPAAPPLVAVNPKSSRTVPIKHTQTMLAQGKPRLPATVHPAIRHEERVATAAVPFPESTPAIVPHPPARSKQIVSKQIMSRQMASAPKPPAVNTSLVKTLKRTEPNPSLIASSHPIVTEHKPSMVTLPSMTPKAPVATLEASLPKAPPTVAVSIGPPTVTNQPEMPHIHLASGILGDTIVRMQHAGYATVFKSASRTMSNVHGGNISDATVQPAIWTPR